MTSDQLFHVFSTMTLSAVGAAALFIIVCSVLGIKPPDRLIAMVVGGVFLMCIAWAAMAFVIEWKG